MIYPRLSVVRSIFLAVTLASKISAYSSSCLRMNNVSPGTFQHVPSDRRAFLSKAAAMSFGAATASKLTPQFGGEAQAVGPVKLNLVRPVYSASICPKDKPIPGEKAMKGMRGLCVTVQAFLEESAPKDLEKVGVYGFVTDGLTGDSVLANNPDLSTDAGQFTMIESVTTKDKMVTFEFVAAMPMERDLSKEDNGIGALDFNSLRLISYPGGQQFGSIDPCEMNEFSQECEDWETVNGPYEKGDFMIKSNSRTKGR
uniref:Photosystem II reaction center Psb28 protein n=1 Tax=Eucampia antarctica TaxID=49252 RepID=A0A7S2QZX4_9STRA|mmetsp:Transcript_10492/g.10060  ORF Transcript_10492/g.10060 Transcript_10492/m.10060 type:complete len:256 (+) Transcript_10492:132-899(+)|eukprot:CAMPEP_0197836182 /NCGR_PEP_ID=MMETSP1437-20131217/28191_1 /TAXON_ID=49252 ORGANISM="Eucampia antarctica, Strain CCMP1452" /NCGR_SAMPLE_ID=MMETSP1437 /ASSEMBLY_ACC=CAM_ASM_001096 /LENGTH=255 /DNA_ID=CAMNT_0043442161 /DNA_START=113 /DNA_END=880 /DNA_ORIENTATION=+